MIRDSAAEALAQADFFDICDDEQKRMLAFAGDLRFYAAGEPLYAAGDVPEGAFVLVSGDLESRDGSAQSLPITRPGSVVSAMALILAKPRPVSIVAASDVEALLVPRHAFLKLVQQSPDLAQRAVTRIEQDLGSYLGALQPLRQRMKRE